jgi:hypothetical protein
VNDAMFVLAVLALGIIAGVLLALGLSAAWCWFRDRNSSRLGDEPLDEIIARETLGYGPPHWSMSPNGHVATEIEDAQS